MEIIVSPTITVRYIGHNGNPVQLTEITPHIQFGVYIVQARKRPNLFRVGAGGVRSSNPNLRSRLKTHTDSRNAANITSHNRPWDIIWVAELMQVDNVTTLLAESCLLNTFATSYPFVQDSIFYDRDVGVTRIVELANLSLTKMRAVCEYQSLARQNLPADLNPVDLTMTPELQTQAT